MKLTIFVYNTSTYVYMRKEIKKFTNSQVRCVSLCVRVDLHFSDNYLLCTTDASVVADVLNGGPSDDHVDHVRRVFSDHLLAFTLQVFGLKDQVANVVNDVFDFRLW